MYQSVKCTSTLCQMRIVGIIGSDAIQYKIQAIGKIGDAGSQTVQIESVFYIGSFDFAKHFVSLQTTEPVGIPTIRHVSLFRNQYMR